MRIVYYHDNCTDGFAAAFAVYKMFGNGPDVKYVPCNYGEAPPDPADYADKRVIIADFSFPLEVMTSMMKLAKHFTWLDHHKTAFEAYGVAGDRLYESHSDKVDIVLDPTRSGALIAFDWFFDKETANKAFKLVYNINDRDLWHFKLRDTKEVHEALQLIRPWSFEQWDQLNQSFFEDDDNYQNFINTGRTALKVQNNHVTSASKHPVKCSITFTDNDCNVLTAEGLAVNSTVHMSEIGNELCKQSGTYGLIYVIDQQNRARCNIRSTGDYDVSIIAKNFGGGGHRNASGFSVSISQLMKFLGKEI